MLLHNSLFLFGSFLLHMASCQEMRSTWPPSFNPGEECLAYDGSKVPDCRDFIDPITKEPYYHPHSYNCSRFWECGPTFETCLFECAHCNNADMNNPLCKGQEALTFDPKLQWPFGPVCNWPNTIDCNNDNVPCDCLPWQSCINAVCSPQCKEDVHCPDGYICDECNWCIEGEVTPDPGCAGDDSVCLQGECDVPWPYTTCEYCGKGDQCLPGCSSDSNCPSMYPVCGDGGDHLCGCTLDSQCPSGYVCDTDSNMCTEYLGCSGDDSVCLQGECDVPWPYTTCEYCGDGDQCLPGCSSDSNCPSMYPVCGGGGDHLCGCTLDSQCPSGYVCDTDSNMCTEYLGCSGDDSVCLQGECDVPWPYTTCEYCGNGDQCLPGCSSDSNCPSMSPVCGDGGGDHLCGCTIDSQCPSGYVCDVGDHVCTEDLGCNNNDLNCLHAQCDEPMNWPYTTCEYCDDAGGKDCLPGCSDDTVCPPEYPVCGHGGIEHKCGCNDIADCGGLGPNYICDVDNHQCIPGCLEDSDCPNDICDIENSPYTTCTYCDTLMCVPGCASDKYCPSGFECVDYFCEVKPAGYILLNEITVSGAGAGAYTMELVGNHGTANPATCSTNQLTGSGTFTGDSQLGEVLKHGCNLAPLNGEISAGSVIGGESWTGATACFDWNDDNYFVFDCSISGGSLVDCSNAAGNTQC